MQAHKHIPTHPYKKKKEKKAQKDQKKAEKKQAKAEKKAQKEREKQAKPKKEKKPKVVEKSKPLPKKPVFMIMLVGASLVVLIYLVTTQVGYTMDIANAKEYYENGDYVEAYTCFINRRMERKPFIGGYGY